MRCPFRYRPRTKFSFGVDPGFVDYVMESEDRAEKSFNRKYPTCWDKFLHWLGREGKPVVLTPCPYCQNPDRDFWLEDPTNSSGACKFDIPGHGGSDPPCICNNYGTLRGY